MQKPVPSSTPTPEPTGSVTAQDTSQNTSKGASSTHLIVRRSEMRRSERALIASAIPPLLFVGFALCVRNPVPQDAQSARLAQSGFATTLAKPIAGVLSPADTMIASLKPTGGFSTLSGELQPAIQVRGQAPIEGRVTQVLVKTGQQVTVGEPVLRVESKVKAPGSRSAIRKQDAAEAAQVAAAHQQEALQGRLATRQQKLTEAQARVARAQKRVAMARAIVGRLARGENISRAEVATLSATEPKTRLASRGTASQRREEVREAAQTEAKKEAALAARRTAQQEAEQAHREAERATLAANEAKSDAQKALKTAQTKADGTNTKNSATKDTPKEGIKDPARLTVAPTKAPNTAENDDKVIALQKIADKKEAEATRLRMAAAEADKKLAALPDPTKVAATPTPEKTATPVETLSPNEAMQLAQDALGESKQAAAEAERIKEEIDSYAHQVNSLQSRLSSTSNNLQAAQMQVVESKIAEKLEAVRSPATGVVLDVAETSSNVTPGETIIAIGRPDRLEVRFEDKSDAWKTLKTGAQLPVTVQSDGENAAILAEVQDIKVPRRPGQAALVTTVINNPRRENGNGRRFRSGLKVQCSISRPGARSALTIPSAALWQETDGRTLVAVLVPLEQDSQPPVSETPRIAPQTDQNTPVLPAPPAPSEPAQPATALPAAPTMTFHVEWRTVTTGEGNALQREIAVGLKPGERIALRPAPLREITSTHGPDAVVKLSA